MQRLFINATIIFLLLGGAIFCGSWLTPESYAAPVRLMGLILLAASIAGRLYLRATTFRVLYAEEYIYGVLARWFWMFVGFCWLLRLKKAKEDESVRRRKKRLRAELLEWASPIVSILLIVHAALLGALLFIGQRMQALNGSVRVPFIDYIYYDDFGKLCIGLALVWALVLTISISRDFLLTRQYRLHG